MKQLNYYNQMYPDKNKSPHLYQYIVGNSSMSIAESRWNYLFELSLKHPEMKIAFQNPVSKIWTKWETFHNFDSELLYLGYDLHRTLLDNEIVIESDYEDYKDNRRASQYLGQILQNKGIVPHYYFSGSKSIHIHVFLDFEKLSNISESLQKQIVAKFNTKSKFIDTFKFWIRELIIDCWGMKTYQFDRALIKDTHLIRAELSKNKLGCKTFLGYHLNDIPLNPTICNSETMEYPEIAVFNPTESSKIEHSIKLSFPKDSEALIKEFLSDYEEILRKQKLKPKFTSNYVLTEIRPLVKFMMQPEFKKARDGFKRAMFIIANELKNVYSSEKALEILRDWNNNISVPLRDEDLIYRIKNKTQYKISNKYIYDFLYELGYTYTEINKFKLEK